MRNLSKKQGFSIIELMIALLVGALIIAGVGNIYLTQKKSYVLQDALSRVMENGRVSHYLLSKDLRMIGYQGCTGQAYVTIQNLVKGPSDIEMYTTPLQGYSGNSSSFSPSLPSSLALSPMTNSDVIEIRMASELDMQLRDDMNNPQNPVHVLNRLGIQANDIVMITDCTVGDIFKVGANTNADVLVHNSQKNISDELSTAYSTNAKIARFIYYAYYIKDSGRKNSQNEPIFVLVRKNISGVEEEIAEGIESIKFLYGIDTNGDASADQYQTASEVQDSNNWSKVVSIQFRLLLATTENIADKVLPYQFNHQTVIPTDRKIREEWIGFVNIRNKGVPS